MTETRAEYADGDHHCEYCAKVKERLGAQLEGEFSFEAALDELRELRWQAHQVDLFQEFAKLHIQREEPDRAERLLDEAEWLNQHVNQEVVAWAEALEGLRNE